VAFFREEVKQEKGLSAKASSPYEPRIKVREMWLKKFYFVMLDG